MFRQKNRFSKGEHDQTSSLALCRSDNIELASRLAYRQESTEGKVSSSPSLLSKHSDHDDCHRSSLSVPNRKVVNQNDGNKCQEQKNTCKAMDDTQNDGLDKAKRSAGGERVARLAPSKTDKRMSEKTSFTPMPTCATGVKFGMDPSKALTPPAINETETNAANSYPYQHSSDQEAPGAYRVRGFNRNASSNSMDDLMDVSLERGEVEEMPTPVPFCAEIVNDDEECRQVEQEMFKEAVLADVVVPHNKRRRLVVRGCILVATALVAIVVAVVVSVIRRQKRHAPVRGVNGTVETNGTIIPDDMNRNNSNATITQLVDAASNHTILTRLLSDEYLSDLLNETAFEATLFAPCDESFQVLFQQPHYSYYQNVSWWYHLNLLLQSHIIAEPLNSTQIFGMPELSTYASNLNQPVNETDHTIADGAKIVFSDIRASNGYIQVPDRVLLTESLRTTVLDWLFQTNSPRIRTEYVPRLGGFLSNTKHHDIGVAIRIYGFCAH